MSYKFYYSYSSFKSLRIYINQKHFLLLYKLLAKTGVDYKMTMLLAHNCKALKRNLDS